MNDDSSNDLAIQAFEAQLMAHRPKLADREVRDLLYGCAFAAGQKSAIRETRRWQLASASMAVLLLGMSIPLAHVHLVVARPEPATNRPATTAQVPTPGKAATSWSPIAAVPLDAWQVQENTETKFDSELAKFQRMNADASSLAVGTWRRAMAPAP
jgi:hypothetical protein